MEFKRTRDHDTIQAWVEEHGGEPVELDLSPETEGLITVNFGRFLPEDFRRISWEEFFAWFDSRRLVFRYCDNIQKGEEERSYNFISGKNISEAHDDELSLPEANEMAEENIDTEFQEPKKPDYVFDDISDGGVW
jgi:hypothetical protein